MVVLEQNHHYLAFANSYSIQILLLYFLDLLVEAKFFFFWPIHLRKKISSGPPDRGATYIKFAQDVCGRGGEGQSMAPIRGRGYIGPELLFGLNGDLKVVNFHFLLLMNGKSFICYKKE